MAITQLNQLQIAYKKLLGKAHVSPNRTVPQELISSLIQIGNTTVFGEIIPTSSAGFPSNLPANLYQTSSNGKVELVRFELTALNDGLYTPITGSLANFTSSIDDQAENVALGNHAYALRISGSYNTRSNNPNKNTGFFKDGTFLTGSLGALQLVPPTFGVGYSAFVYSGSGAQIFDTGELDWSLDYSTGVLFVQDYSATTIPAFVDAYLYIGKYQNEVISDINTSVSNTNAYASASVGGTVLISSAAGDRNLTFASGAFAGSTNTNNNLLISGSAGNDTITFSFNDSPRFTHITASGNISGSGNLSITGTSTLTDRLSANGAITTTNITASEGINLISDQTGSARYNITGSQSTNVLRFRDTDTTSDVTQSMGRIVFESLDADTSGSSNQFIMKAFIEGVSEDATPDAFLAFGTGVSGSNATERMRITSTGNVGIGTTSPTNTLQVAGGIIAVNITASGTPTAATATDVLIIGSSGQVSKISTSSLASLLTGQSVLSFATMSVGGTTLIADNSIDSLTINSGSFSGSATTHNNLRISASQDDTITFSFLDEPTFTTLTTTGNATFGGDINVNGGDISTTNANAYIFTSNAANISIGTSATTMTIGSTTGTTTVQNNLTVGGDLTVNGTTTILNTENLLVEDKFILLASGSHTTNPQDSGIIVQTSTGSAGSGPTGSAFFLNGAVGYTGNPAAITASARWGLNASVPHTATSVIPTDYMVSVSSSNSNPSNSAPPTYGGRNLGFGNMFVNSDTGELWFWSPDGGDNANVIYGS